MAVAPFALSIHQRGGKHRVSSIPEIGCPSSRCQEAPRRRYSHAVETAPPARFHAGVDRGRWQWQGAGRRVVAFRQEAMWGRRGGAELVLQSCNIEESISLTRQESASTEHARALRWSSRQHLDDPQDVCGSRKLNNRDSFGLGRRGGGRDPADALASTPSTAQSTKSPVRTAPRQRNRRALEVKGGRFLLAEN